MTTTSTCPDFSFRSGAPLSPRNIQPKGGLIESFNSSSSSLYRRMQDISAAVRNVQEDAGEVKNDMRDTREDIGEVSADVAAIRSDLADVREEFRSADVAAIKSELADMHEEMRAMNAFLREHLLPRTDEKANTSDAK